MNKKFDMGAPLKLVVALSIGAITAWLGGELMPLTMGVLTDGFKFSLEHAGVLLSAEMAGVAALSLLISPFVGKMDLRKMAFIGGLVVISGQSMTAMATGDVPVGVSRFIAVAGTGILTAVLFAAVARTKEPERLMGLMEAVFALVGAFFLVLLPYVISGFGPRTYFWALAALVLCTFWVFTWLPKSSAEEEEKNKERPSVSVPVVCLVAFSSAALFSGQTLIWSFSERIGVTLGLSMEQIGWVLGGTGLTGLVGAAFPTSLMPVHRSSTPFLCLATDSSLASTCPMQWELSPRWIPWGECPPCLAPWRRFARFSCPPLAGIYSRPIHPR
jgi:predicted MFS family arabinose efflux permease